MDCRIAVSERAPRRGLRPTIFADSVLNILRRLKADNGPATGLCRRKDRGVCRIGTVEFTMDCIVEYAAQLAARESEQRTT